MATITKKTEHHHTHDAGKGKKSSVGKAEAFYQKNNKTVNIIGIIIIILIGGYYGIKYLYLKPRQQHAVTMVYMAQHYFAIDSFRLALHGDGNNYGYLQVINKYGGTKVGNQAKYAAGVCYIHLGKFKEGISYLKKFDADDHIVQAIDYGLIGDAYMELGNTQQGVKYYKKAGNYNKNDLTAPLYLMRAGLALEKEGKTKAAISVYKKIKKDYPNSVQGRKIGKYLARLGVTQ